MAAERSPRGPFEIFRAPPIQLERAPDDVTEEMLAEAVEAWEHSDLLAGTDDEHDAIDALTDYFRAASGGSASVGLFNQLRSGGMSLAHAWFGPGFPLFRHSHPRLGDCLYYVLAGEVLLGARTLRAGDGFFVPNGMPYRFRAGPNGCEVLEFRTGGGTKGAPVFKLDESSPESLRSMAATAREVSPAWDPPAAIVDRSLFTR